jgi:hypothetical protein
VLVNLSILIAFVGFGLYYAVNDPEIVEFAREKSQRIFNELDTNKLKYFIIVGSIVISYAVSWLALRILNNTSQYRKSRAARIRTANNSYYKFNSYKESKIEDFESDTSSLYEPEESLNSEESVDSAKEDRMLTKKYLKYAYDKPTMQVYKEASGEPCSLDSENESETKL